MPTPVALCTLIMPSGKRCGCPAMRNQNFCHHHSRNHAGHERAQTREKMLERLDAKIQAMGTAELLHFLYGQLGRLNKTLDRFPDIHYTVLASLQRIDEISQMESILKQQIRRNEEFMTRIAQSQMKSFAQPQVAMNQ